MPNPTCPCGLTVGFNDDCPTCHWDWPDLEPEVCVICGRDSFGGLCPACRETELTERLDDLT